MTLFKNENENYTYFMIQFLTSVFCVPTPLTKYICTINSFPKKKFPNNFTLEHLSERLDYTIKFTYK